MLYDDEPPQHDVALICLSGHVINDSYQTMPQFNAKHCDKCGEPAINACQNCKSPIRGQISGVLEVGTSAPSFCHECGKPYPWTEQRLAAAKEIADELDGLSDDDKSKLQGTLDDLSKEGPRTELAKLRFKQIMKKAGREGYEMMKTVVTDLVSETVRKSLFGPGQS